jgi:hypothetical protein
MRDAIDESTTSLIARRLIGEYQQNAISAITGGTFPVRGSMWRGRRFLRRAPSIRRPLRPQPIRRTSPESR